MAKLVSQVYAEALFGLGVENGLLDTLLEELNGMCEILGGNPQFVTLLGHPELDQKEKQRSLTGYLTVKSAKN